MAKTCHIPNNSISEYIIWDYLDPTISHIYNVKNPVDILCFGVAGWFAHLHTTLVHSNTRSLYMQRSPTYLVVEGQVGSSYTITRTRI